jgi:hypothetical protein
VHALDSRLPPLRGHHTNLLITADPQRVAAVYVFLIVISSQSCYRPLRRFLTPTPGRGLHRSTAEARWRQGHPSGGACRHHCGGGC